MAVISLLALWLEASCAPRAPVVSPQKGELPTDGVLYARARWLEARAADDQVLEQTELWREGTVAAVRVKAAPGTSFTVTAKLDGDEGDIRRFGPYLVAARSAPAPGAAELLAAHRTIGAVHLELQPAAPAWAVEVDSARVLLVSPERHLGWFDCESPTYDWGSGSVSIRAQALGPSGTAGAWSNALHVRAPLPHGSGWLARLADALLERALIISLALTVAAVLLGWTVLRRTRGKGAQ